MGKPKIVLAAEAAEAAGYEYMASILKSVNHIDYWQVVPIVDILRAGSWPAAGKLFSYKHGGTSITVGVTTSMLPMQTISRREALRLVDND
jgi:hypothetical protein